MSEFRERITMKNWKLIVDNRDAGLKEQLKEEAKLNALIAENLKKVKFDG